MVKFIVSSAFITLSTLLAIGMISVFLLSVIVLNIIRKGYEIAKWDKFDEESCPVVFHSVIVIGGAIQFGAVYGVLCLCV